MVKNQIIQVRVIANKELANQFVTKLIEVINTDSYEVLQEPSVCRSRRNSDHVMIYSQWIKKI